jgi:hypothetical protein
MSALPASRSINSDRRCETVGGEREREGVRERRKERERERERERGCERKREKEGV